MTKKGSHVAGRHEGKGRESERERETRPGPRSSVRSHTRSSCREAASATPTQSQNVERAAPGVTWGEAGKLKFRYVRSFGKCFNNLDKVNTFL